jgi:[ribosomal protein S5]-alanine N-acetyltransferase
VIFGTSVSLGPILPIDLPKLFLWADDSETAKLNETYRPAIWKQQEDFWTNIGNDASCVFFAIRPKRSTEIIGFVQITNIAAVHRSAVIGLRIGDAIERGKGYGGEALRLAIDYCWNHLNLSRLGLSVFAHNDRAIRLYASLGFETEGTLRKAAFIDGRWTDIVLMALTHASRASKPAAAA